ncbi:hypothetical protein J3458_000177 [Metarhizium acridum]|uniref:uncharacterized protein n=1 Tax=Metarhizium acridum TaxID=92637 RepID=UPI001C6C5A56|nr:hypothetical protein J3458_000177 [Metarhizium acridum]
MILYLTISTTSKFSPSSRYVPAEFSSTLFSRRLMTAMALGSFFILPRQALVLADVHVDALHPRRTLGVGYVVREVNPADFDAAECLAVFGLGQIDGALKFEKGEARRGLDERG